MNMTAKDHVLLAWRWPGGHWQDGGPSNRERDELFRAGKEPEYAYALAFDTGERGVVAPAGSWRERMEWATEWRPTRDYRSITMGEHDCWQALQALRAQPAGGGLGFTDLERAMLRNGAHMANERARTKGDHWDQLGDLLTRIALARPTTPPESGGQGEIVTDAEIAEWRSLRGEGMTSAVGEYTPREFWDALDEIERLRKAQGGGNER